MKEAKEKHYKQIAKRHVSCTLRASTCKSEFSQNYELLNTYMCTSARVVQSCENNQQISD